ncbi:hypothetical protein OHA21_19940 [Actinoplanes sp. NBC_00393]|uniref:hypothetical protein n=1 Tax=Actinoplanes sp. NBC_00393 TaxID=2975953 RepID=UPI002E209008
MANPLGIGRELADGSILSFTPDSRFGQVAFDCYRGDEVALTVSLPFLGWAVVAFRQVDEPGCYLTRLLAVGLGEDGTPCTEVDVQRLHDLEPGEGIQTRLIAVVAAVAPAVEPRNLSRIPIDEIISSFDIEPDPLFDASIFPLPNTSPAELPDDADADADPEI